MLTPEQLDAYDSLPKLLSARAALGRLSEGSGGWTLYEDIAQLTKRIWLLEQMIAILEGHAYR